MAHASLVQRANEEWVTPFPAVPRGGASIRRVLTPGLTGIYRLSGLVKGAILFSLMKKPSD